VVAANPLPDFHGLALELVRLERREAGLARRLEKVQDRACTFPTPFVARQVTAMEDEHRAMVERIVELQALLVPARRDAASVLVGA
jgi:hypothetical protein